LSEVIHTYIIKNNSVQNAVAVVKLNGEAKQVGCLELLGVHRVLPSMYAVRHVVAAVNYS